MTKTQTVGRVLVIAAAALALVALTAGGDGVAEAKGWGQCLTGTWFVKLPVQGLTGYYTYHAGGTLTGAVSNMYGAEPWPPGFPTYSSPDHGVWRKVRRGFEATVYRMTFDPTTGTPTVILRIRMTFAFDGSRNRTKGTFVLDQWLCPDALSCPDPSTTPPDVENIELPPPLNTFTQSRAPR